MDGEEPTQATQNVLDPRRVGQQNTGFADEDVSDIICVLYPNSESAREEVQRLVYQNSDYVIGRTEADNVEPDYDLEDDASRFESNNMIHGNHAIMLRLSSRLKNPAAGFAFGRNPSRCDVVFGNDPLHRVSNVHFRIYVNEYGSVMIEDQSTNGTYVDDTLLASKGRPNSVQKRVLSSGARIKLLLHEAQYDINFRVRIPRRDEDYEAGYMQKIGEYFTRHGIPRADEVVTASPGGHPDLFRQPTKPAAQPRRVLLAPDADNKSPAKGKGTSGTLSREWTGSGVYNKTGTIGKGAFAVVYKVTSKYDGKPYAAKELEKRRFIKNGVLDQKVENEMKIMQRINHPNIVRYIENFDWQDRLLIIIMEYVPNGDLGKLIHDNHPFTEETSKIFSVQLLSALGYLHANNITHRDVKPDNILINRLEPLEVKLTDFGLSKVIDSEQTFLRTFCGTLLYCAPEVYTEFVEYDDSGHRVRGKPVRRMPGQRYSHAVDIWSLGGVLFYCLTGKPPYPVKNGISPSELLHRVMTTHLNIIPLEQRGISSRGIDFLNRMLQRRPEKRATVLNLQEHSWLKELEEEVQMSQSYDEITDDESYGGMVGNPDDLDEDHVSESMDDDDSDEENRPTMRPPPQPRLFGEVGSSAIGSSGAIPAAYLNLPVDNPSVGETEILDDEDEAYNSAESSHSQRRPRHFLNQQQPSMYQRQSMDQLQSLVEDVASQSLGNRDPNEEEPSPNISRQSIFSLDPSTSKRKPPSQEANEEWDENTPPGKPIIKRFKSETNIEDSLSHDMIEEFQLICSVPEIKRLGSGRQHDAPVNKTVFWAQDQSTWHLNYPEFTHLQYDMFGQAATARAELFKPGDSPLWQLAMKHFPPTSIEEKRGQSPGGSLQQPLLSEQSTRTATYEYPPTADIMMRSDVKFESSPTDPRIVPIMNNDVSKQAIAVVESDIGSSIPGISLPITDTLLSFGRGPENTQVYDDKLEQKIPKYGFKLLLWKENFNPAIDFVKHKPPWQAGAGVDADSFFFWISSKATNGILINDQPLSSHNSKNPSGSSRYWAKVYNGDVIVLAGTKDAAVQTRVVFRCFWGGSSKSRSVATGDEYSSLELASPPVAQQLDLSCPEVVNRIAKQRRNADAALDFQLRISMPQRERVRSDAFQRKRLEAMKFLSDRQPLATRKLSGASLLSAHDATMKRYI